MRHAGTLLVLARLASFAGCQACSDETDYSSPVVSTGPVEYSGEPLYTDATSIPQGAVVVPQEDARVDGFVP